jgi:hypothetical protein
MTRQSASAGTAPTGRASRVLVRVARSPGSADRNCRQRAGFRVARGYRPASEYESIVRQSVGTDASFSLRVETVDVDAYWGYWLDGVGENVRLRLNLRHAQFTKVGADSSRSTRFLGDTPQSGQLHRSRPQVNVPWVRLLSVHAAAQ